MQSAQRKYEYDIPTYPAKKRTVKMRGNVAYINIDPVKPVTKARPGVQTRPAKKTQVRQKARNKANAAAKAKAAAQAEALRRERVRSRKSLASTLFVVFMAFCALSLVISRYAVMCIIGSQNNEITDNIEAVEAQIDELQLDMELRDNVEDVQSKAQDELGMAYPRQDQKISIDMSG